MVDQELGAVPYTVETMCSRESVFPFTVKELLYTVETSSRRSKLLDTVEILDSGSSRRTKLLNTVETLDCWQVYGDVGFLLPE